MTNNLIRNGVSCGLDKMMQAADDAVRKTREDLRGEGREFYIPDYFPDFLPKKQENEDTLEDFVKNNFENLQAASLANEHDFDVSQTEKNHLSYTHI